MKKASVLPRVAWLGYTALASMNIQGSRCTLTGSIRLVGDQQSKIIAENVVRIFFR